MPCLIFQCQSVRHIHMMERCRSHLPFPSAISDCKRLVCIVGLFLIQAVYKRGHIVDRSLSLFFFFFNYFLFFLKTVSIYKFNFLEKQVHRVCLPGSPSIPAEWTLLIQCHHTSHTLIMQPSPPDGERWRITFPEPGSIWSCPVLFRVALEHW